MECFKLILIKLLNSILSGLKGPRCESLSKPTGNVCQCLNYHNVNIFTNVCYD